MNSLIREELSKLNWIGACGDMTKWESVQWAYAQGVNSNLNIIEEVISAKENCTDLEDFLVRIDAVIEKAKKQKELSDD